MTNQDPFRFQENLPQRNGDREPPRILIVDDEDHLGRFVSIGLMRSGYATVVCSSAEDARHWLRTGAWSLVITDVVMPKETGFDLIRWLQENHPQLPVVVMTAHSLHLVQAQADSLGIVEILGKPFTLQQLRETVQRLVGQPVN